MLNLPDNIDSLLVTHLPNVRYLTGFTGTAGFALLSGRRRLFFTDFRYEEQAAREVEGFRVRIVKGAFPSGFSTYVTGRRLKLGTLGVEYARLSHAHYRWLKKELKGIRIKDAGGVVEQARRIKSRKEVDSIRKAATIADDAFAWLRRHKLSGRSEKQVAWMLESYMREAGSGPLPFEIIVASGPRSAMPHGVASDRIIRRDELVVIDMGASIGGYCCDITRTFSTGTLSGRRLKIYETVCEAQERALVALEPGLACKSADKVARDHIKKAGFGKEFGHSLGHGVGLEAHEAPLLAPRSKDVLEAGMVVTVEPGIYKGRTGVRIEDTVLITAEGAVSLTSYRKDPVSVR